MDLWGLGWVGGAPPGDWCLLGFYGAAKHRHGVTVRSKNPYLCPHRESVSSGRGLVPVTTEAGECHGVPTTSCTSHALPGVRDRRLREVKDAAQGHEASQGSPRRACPEAWLLSPPGS